MDVESVGPDRVARRALHEDTVACGKKELLQILVLRILGKKSVIHDYLARAVPDYIIEVLDLTAVALDRVRVRRCHDLHGALRVTEKYRFLVHHILLQAGISYAEDTEPALVPVAQIAVLVISIVKLDYFRSLVVQKV